MQRLFNIIIFLSFSLNMLTVSYAGEPTLIWDTIMVSIPPGYFIQYFNKNSITIYPKDKRSNVHIAIECNDISTKLSVINSTGRKENNCMVTYIKDFIFDEYDAFEWKTSCPSIGTRKCITVPEKNCEICFYGEEDKFHEVEQLLNCISFIKNKN